MALSSPVKTSQKKYDHHAWPQVLQVMCPPLDKFLDLLVHCLQYSDSNSAKIAATLGKLTKELVCKEYKDCFDKLGRFSEEKYNIKLIDSPVSVVHPSRTVPVHILLLYKVELEKMLAEDIMYQLLNL